MLTQEADTRPALSNSRSRVRTPGMRLDSRGSIIFAAVVLTIVIGGAVASMLIPQFDPLRADFSAAMQPPSPAHWFGTDATGRDIFARTMAGGLSSLVVAALTLAVGLVVGSFIGIVAGFFGRIVDEIIGTVIDLMLALPGLILIMVVVSLVGSDYWTIGLLIGTLTIPIFARIARSATLSVREREFVQAARLLGLPESTRDVPEGAIERGIVAQESAADYARFFKDILDGRPEGHTSVKLRTTTKNAYSWFNADYSLVYDTDGSPITASDVAFT
ncbi:MAG: ABC transporter permease, partial [Actinomyces sp.]|nr:ABC transporter permease [Actinomyces sp.]